MSTLPVNAEDAIEQVRYLQVENAKLLVLVDELAHTIVKCQNGECVDCQFGNPTGFGCRWDAHMRKLGIEVY